MVQNFEMKSFPCLKCGGHIGYEPSDAGQVGACPHCGTPNIVPKDRRIVAAILTAVILSFVVLLFYIHRPPEQTITVSTVEKSPLIVKTPPTTPPPTPPKPAALTETNPIPAQTQPEPSVELKLTRYNMGQENERLRLITQDYGIDPTDRLLRQLNLVKSDSVLLSNQLVKLDMGQSNAPLAKAYLEGSLDYLSLAKINIQQALAQRSAEIDRDIKQLEIDGQKKFMREFYGY